MKFLSKDEPVDLTNCEREPIHIPGLIQPHGFIICLDQHLVIRGISHNLLVLTKTQKHQFLGQEITSFIQDFEESIKNESLGFKKCKIAGLDLNYNFNLSIDKEYIIEFYTPSKVKTDINLDMYQSKIERLYLAKDREEIYARILDAIELVTQYDRLMFYVFDRKWNGHIIEELKKNHLESFKGLHYPASDIPPQARVLYTKKMSRLIVDVNYQPVDLIQADTRPIDLTYCNLRSVSPIHIQYLKNMGVKATFVLSIMVKGQLWGLVACHNYESAKELTVEEQMKCETAAMFASMKIESFIDREAFENSKRISDISSLIFNEDSLLAINNQAALSIVSQTTGVTQFFEGNAFSVGFVPPIEMINQVVDWLDAKMGGENFYETNCISQIIPDFINHKNIASGFLAIRLNPSLNTTTANNYFIWFRPEFIETVSWGGDPHKSVTISNNTHELSPRRSFAVWKEENHKMSKSWTQIDVDTALIFRGFLLEKLLSYQAKKRNVAERALLEAERMKDIGLMTASISHDFNNFLQAIRGNLDIFIEKTQILNDSNLQKINSQIDKGSKLISSLMDYSRAHQTKPSFFSTYELFEAVVLLSKPLVKKEIKFLSLFEPSANFNIYGNQQDLYQVIVNLVSNAKDAITRENGIIELSMKLEMPTSISDQKAPRFMIQVKDNGSGIEKDDLPKVFNPFFTTKRPGKGTGLGLANTKKVISDHKGEIIVDSVVGLGTTFTIYIPLSETQQNEILLEEKAPTSSKLKKSEKAQDLTMIYVEDDEDLLEIYTHLFKKIFRKVYAYNSAQKALDFLRDNPKGCDGIISDYRMPSMDGFEFFQALESQNITLPFFLLTGEANIESLKNIMDSSQRIIHLPKPISKELIIQAVNNVF